MPFQPRRRRRATLLCLAFSFFLMSLPAWAAEKVRLRVDDYQIDAELTPHSHKLAARARVKFTALEDLNVATFELHNALRVTKALDMAGKPLSVERVTQDSSVRVQLNNPLPKDASTTISFEYEGTLDSADDSPVQGLKLASVNDDTSYLLYAGRWFPVNAYGINRFTATMSITVPAHMVVIGSGDETMGTAPAPRKPAMSGLPTKTYVFTWSKPSFPGMIVAGTFQEFKSDEAGLDLHVFFKPAHQNLGASYANTAVKEFTYYVTLYGPAPSTRLRVVELPDDTVPAAWAPEIAGIASRAVTEKVNYRLLANTIARQWWGVSVSPASRDDWWLSDGFARYSEARYVEQAAGPAGLEETVKDMSVGALAYDTVPLSSAGKLDLFSPEFQSLVTDKGAMILHMLRWVLGDQKYDQTMRTFAAKYAGKSATLDDFRAMAEKYYGDQLTWFFSQWLDSTGAPEFKTKYTIYRLGNNKGFRVVGQITQDLDLFRMPVELKIDTDGKTEQKRVEVVGTNSAFTVETFGKPRRIAIDPDDRVLKNSAEVRLRASIQRGQGLTQQGDLAGALSEFNKALDVNKNSSLAHYRIAEVFFMQRNFQAAANAYRDCLNGDGEPRWTEVWSHIQLGKIFDLTGQRERATNEYRQALQTNDNTQGALDEARKYLQKAFEQQKSNG
ncbi:MAG TPA: M1 family aminopeptidase [Terriglobales bacterium]|jgi:tetratricopeptide (TPR) repeat protein|nr:M1 family aminopeptidase [Terriglobales bacterium]